MNINFLSKPLELILKAKVKRLFKLHHPTVIAVTGTVGKTSTKVMIGRILSKIYQDKKVEYSLDSYNSPIGMPLGIFGLKVPESLYDIKGWGRILREINARIKNFDADILIIEVAEDDPEYMPALTKIIKPDIMIVTAVSLAHTARSIDEDNILLSINSLTQYAKKVIKNNDFKLLRDKVKGDGFALKGQIGEWEVDSINREQDYSLTINISSKTKKPKHLSIPTNIIGEHNLYGILAALMVIQDLDSEYSDFEVLGHMKDELSPVNGRMNLLRGIKDSYIIDDSYNAASPIGVIAALNTLHALPAQRKIALLGNMNELGDKSIDEHIKIGKYAVTKADVLLFLGPHMSEYAFASAQKALDNDTDDGEAAAGGVGAGSDGVGGDVVDTDDDQANTGDSQIKDKVILKKFQTPYQAGEYLSSIIRSGDLVLVKGSQNNVFSEEAIKYVLSQDLKPENVLVRQSSFWLAKKKNSFSLDRD